MKFLVSGLGSAGLRHAKNLIALGHEVYGSDFDSAKLKEAKVLGVKCYGPYENPYTHDMDGLIIATPTADHAEQLGFAVSMGKHCLVEKPIAEKYEIDLELVLALAKKKNLVVMVGNNQRFRSQIQGIKERLAKMEDPLCATFILSQHNTKYTDHVILNWGAHELDLARYLLGPCKVVACVGNPKIADIILQHENGCQTTVHLNYVGDPETREFLIVGNRGRARCDLVSEDMLLGLNRSYVDEIKAFIDRINGKADPIGATGEDGLETLKLITAAMEMAK